MGKETNDINILIISTIGGRKNHATYKNKELISHKNKDAELFQPVQKKIYQRNTYRRELSRLHLKDEPRVQEKPQLKEL